MNFEKRDLILIAGLLLFMVGLVPFMPLIYAILIATAMYFGIKFYMHKRQQQVGREVGEGLCADCGSRICGRRCPSCDGDV